MQVHMNSRSWAFIAAVLAMTLATSLIWSRAVARPSIDLAEAQAEISRLETTLAKLKAKPRSPAVSIQWQKASRIVAELGLQLDTSNVEETRFAPGVLDKLGGIAWYGRLSGDTRATLVAAIKLQSQLPVAYSRWLPGETGSVITLAVLGSVGGAPI